MNFNVFLSLESAFFVAAAAVLFYTIPISFRCGFLVLAGAVFSAYFAPTFLAALWVVILAGYIAGRVLRRAGPRLSGFILFLAAAVVLSVPYAWMRWDDWGASFTSTATALRWDASVTTLGMFMPIGLAFHGFQTLGYLMDVRRGRASPETSLPRYAAAMLFFPTLMAGPIRRPAEILSQLDEARRWDPAEVSKGLQMILWGVFKKAAIADRLAVFVDPILDEPAGREGLLLLLASLGFAVQIYCDFSGYSDMACGSARLLGVRIGRNFDAPFLARSFRDYWRRWHISFAEWIRDYVYRPLGGGRSGAGPARRNLMLAFLVGGLCYGVRGTFGVWAVLNGLAVLAGDAAARLAGRAPSGAWGRICRFAGRGGIPCAGVFAATSFFWIFFRAQSLSDAVYTATHLFAGAENWARYSYWSQNIWNIEATGFGKRQWFLALLFIAVLIVVEKKNGAQKWTLYTPNGFGRPLRWLCHYAVVLTLLFFGVFRHQFANI